MVARSGETRKRALPWHHRAVSVRRAVDDDLPGIVAIYNHYVEHSVVTFDVTPATVPERRLWFEAFDDEHPCYVYEDATGVVAHAYYTQLRAKPAYRRSKELTVYVAPEKTGKGIGKALYTELIAHARGRDVHALIGVLGGDNPASVALHRHFGFVLVGHLREVGFKLGDYVDTFYYELLL
jgi:phosphinothricin acetyltransferase